MNTPDNSLSRAKFEEWREKEYGYRPDCFDENVFDSDIEYEFKAYQAALNSRVDVEALRGELNMYKSERINLLSEADAAEEVLADKRRLTRLLDVALHGEKGAAKQASLCDLIEPAKRLREAYRALVGYARHNNNCDAAYDDREGRTPCSCGFDEALALASGEV